MRYADTTWPQATPLVPFSLSPFNYIQVWLYFSKQTAGCVSLQYLSTLSQLTMSSVVVLLCLNGVHLHMQESASSSPQEKQIKETDDFFSYLKLLCECWSHNECLQKLNIWYDFFKALLLSSEISCDVNDVSHESCECTSANTNIKVTWKNARICHTSVCRFLYHAMC